jgi:hypothetical protein
VDPSFLKAYYKLNMQQKILKKEAKKSILHEFSAKSCCLIILVAQTINNKLEQSSS